MTNTQNESRITPSEPTESFLLGVKRTALYKELTMRERVAAHLRGIPAQQNTTQIARLYDELVAVNIALLEAK
jgi:hypothetical protein